MEQSLKKVWAGHINWVRQDFTESPGVGQAMLTKLMETQVLHPWVLANCIRGRLNKACLRSFKRKPEFLAALHCTWREPLLIFTARCWVVGFFSRL